MQLPKGLRIHPVFYISLLEPAKGKPLLETDTELQPEHETEKYNVERILDSRISKGKVEYLIK